MSAGLGGTRGGAVDLAGLQDDDYIVAFLANTAGTDPVVLGRYADHNNHNLVYALGTDLALTKVVNGKRTVIHAANIGSDPGFYTITLKFSGTTIN